MFCAATWPPDSGSRLRRRYRGTVRGPGLDPQTVHAYFRDLRIWMIAMAPDTAEPADPTMVMTSIEILTAECSLDMNDQGHRGGPGERRVFSPCDPEALPRHDHPRPGTAERRRRPRAHRLLGHLGMTEPVN